MQQLPSKSSMDVDTCSSAKPMSREEGPLSADACFVTFHYPHLSLVAGAPGLCCQGICSCHHHSDSIQDTTKANGPHIQRQKRDSFHDNVCQVTFVKFTPASHLVLYTQRRPVHPDNSSTPDSALSHAQHPTVPISIRATRVMAPRHVALGTGLRVLRFTALFSSLVLLALGAFLILGLVSGTSYFEQLRHSLDRTLSHLGPRGRFWVYVATLIQTIVLLLSHSGSLCGGLFDA